MKRIVIAGLTATLFAALIAACGNDGDSSSTAITPAGNAQPLDVTAGVVIQNATVVNTETGAVSTGQAIVVNQGKIERITANSGIRVTGSATAVDGTGKFVVPGYNDMHTHVLSTGTGAVTAKDAWGSMLLAYGVTGIREMSGTVGPPTAPISLVPEVQAWNASVAAGTRAAPEIVQIGSGVISAAAINPGLTPAAATTIVQTAKNSGAAFLKVVSAVNKPSAQIALAAAKAENFEVAGHLFTAMTVPEHLAAGWHAIEHLGASMGIQLDCAADEASIRASLLGGKGAPPPPLTEAAIFVVNPNAWRRLDAPFVKQVQDTYDEAKCQAIAKQMAAAGVWQIPTLIRLKAMAMSDAAAFRNNADLKYINPTIRNLWMTLSDRFTTDVRTVSPDAALAYENFYGAQRGLIRVLKQNGAKMVTGSDLGGIWVLPGIGLHDEFAELAAGGLMPLEILQMTTINAARFLKREATMGTVAEGKNADLVLLDADPTADVANLGKIAAVFSKGKYFSKAALDQLKADVARVNALAVALPIEAAVDHGHTH